MEKRPASSTRKPSSGRRHLFSQRTRGWHIPCHPASTTPRAQHGGRPRDRSPLVDPAAQLPLPPSTRHPRATRPPPPFLHAPLHAPLVVEPRQSPKAHSPTNLHTRHPFSRQHHGPLAISAPGSSPAPARQCPPLPPPSSEAPPARDDADGWVLAVPVTHSLQQLLRVLQPHRQHAIHGLHIPRTRLLHCRCVGKLTRSGSRNARREARRCQQSRTPSPACHPWQHRK